MLSKYKWELIEPYLDTKIDNGSNGKSRSTITLREFKRSWNTLLSSKSLKTLNPANPGQSNRLPKRILGIKIVIQ